MNTLHDNEKRFYDGLVDVPPMPDCFKGVARQIRQRKFFVRTLCAMAATLVIMTGLLPYRSSIMPVTAQPVAMEATEELQHIQSLFSDSYTSDETTSYSLVNNDLY